MTLPVGSITSSSGNGTYSVTLSCIAVSGSFADTLSGVANGTWLNDAGGSGTATIGGGPLSGTWSIPSVSLSSGVNHIVVTATDAADNQASTLLTVTYLDNSNSGSVTVTLTPSAAVS